MSTPPEEELDLDKLFLPAWAQEPASANLYAEYKGDDRGPRDDRRGPRMPGRRSPAPGGGRGRDGGPGGRPGAPGQQSRGRDQGQRDRREGNRGGPGGPGGRRGDRPGGPNRDQREHRPAPPPLPEVGLSLIPDEKGVDSLAKQIKMTGRAYPLFEIAWMVLQRPERLSVVFTVKKNAEGKVIQPLFVCALDDSIWMSENEAVAHVLQKHFATFYQAERTATEPPKGKYTFVAQCGMSGIILGPPNHHDYQNQLRKLHAERYSRIPFDLYKNRVKIVRDEAVVKKWIDDQSWKTEYLCLNLPEPLKLATMEDVEKHFRETHKENIIKPVETHTMSGTAARNIRSSELSRLVRTVWEDQKRFPLQIATVLSQQFASRGLQFFKVNRTLTHVSVARPYFLDMEATPVSEGVRRIVEFINANPKSTRRKLIDALAPSPATPAAPSAPPAETPAGEVAAPPAAAQPTPEQTAVISDLHWLVHQGHVIEFANGVLETAKKPLPKPPKPESKKAATIPEAPAATELEAAAEAESQNAPESSIPNAGDENASPAADPADQPTPQSSTEVNQGEPQSETPAASPPAPVESSS